MIVGSGTVRWILLLWLASFAAPVVATAERPADVTLQGVIHDVDRATTRDLPFSVPAGAFFKAPFRLQFDCGVPAQGTLFVSVETADGRDTVDVSQSSVQIGR